MPSRRSLHFLLLRDALSALLVPPEPLLASALDPMPLREALLPPRAGQRVQAGVAALGSDAGAGVRALGVLSTAVCMMGGKNITFRRGPMDNCTQERHKHL